MKFVAAYPSGLFKVVRRGDAGGAPPLQLAYTTGTLA